MLYLAEVLRKARVIGSSRAELKLLACQRSELSWSAVPGEEIIAAPDDLSYGAGALVMVELSAGKQVQRHAEAGRQLVSILQNFSRMQEKSKTQEEEIEQWKQSLTYQSQELNRREMEIEAAQDQLQQIEADLERLEKERTEIEASRIEVTQLREEFERKSQELEGAWAQLRGETNRLEERQSELQQMTALDAEQTQYIQSLLDQISAALISTEPIQTQLNGSFEAIQQQQDRLNGYWQQLEEQRSTAQQTQSQTDQQLQSLQERWSTYQQAQAALEQVRIQLEAKQTQLQVQQSQAEQLALRIQSQAELHQSVLQLVEGTSGANLQNLEQMPLEQLQSTVHDLEQELEKLSRFVSSQEEELTLQQQEIDALRQQLQQASEYDRLRLDTEIADEQDRYQMLNETLVGQRRSLQERQVILTQHRTVLAKRQGFPLPEDAAKTIDLAPILTRIDRLRQDYAEQLQSLESQIQSLRAEIEPLQTEVTRQSEAQGMTWNELQQVEQQVREQMAQAAELWGKVNTYEAMLQPAQDNLNLLRQQAEAASVALSHQQEAANQQQQAIQDMRETVQKLTGAPMAELAVS